MTEDKKGTVFGGVALAFVAVVLVLIIVFAVRVKAVVRLKLPLRKILFPFL